MYGRKVPRRLPVSSLNFCFNGFAKRGCQAAGWRVLPAAHLSFHFQAVGPDHPKRDRLGTHGHEIALWRTDPLVTGKRHGTTFASAGVPKRAHYDLLIQQIRHFDQVFRCTLCFYPPTTLIQIWVRTVLGERHTVFSELMLGVVSTCSSGMTSKGTPLR